MDYQDNKPPYIDPREYKAQQLHDFLTKIGALESSSGTNLNHPVIQNGPDAGTHAVGQYGLMPRTAMDIDKASGNQQLDDMDKFQAQDALMKDPELSDRLAQTMASKLLNKNDQETAAYKWLMGQYSNPTPEQIEKSPRVQQFRVLNSKNAPK